MIAVHICCNIWLLLQPHIRRGCLPYIHGGCSYHYILCSRCYCIFLFRYFGRGVALCGLRAGDKLDQTRACYLKSKAHTYGLVTTLAPDGLPAGLACSSLYISGMLTVVLTALEEQWITKCQRIGLICVSQSGMAYLLACLALLYDGRKDACIYKYLQHTY